MATAAEKLFSMSDDEYSTLEERAQDTINEIMLLSSTGAGAGEVPARQPRRRPDDEHRQR